MKRLLRLVICLALMVGMLGSPGAKAEGLFFTIRGASDNAWSSTVLNMLQYGVFAASGGRIGVEEGYTFTIFNLKDNGEKVAVKEGNYWGFKARDMFHFMEFGGKLGWQSPYSPIGIYGQCYYGVNNFRMCFEHDMDYYKYRNNILKLGAGLRVVPLPEDDGSVFFEVGSTYNMVVGGKTPYGHDKSQFNNGVETNFAIGGSFNEYDKIETISLGVDLNLYNFFNKEYSSDGGYYYPYANTKSTSWTIYFRYSITFMAW